MSKKINKDMSRREFAGNLAKLLLCGGLAHFGLNKAIGKGKPNTGKDCPGGGADHDDCRHELVKRQGFETDYCPGGGPDVDVCDPYNLLADNCPGGKAPEDECTASGARKVIRSSIEVGTDDVCDTGTDDADICDNSIVGSDQCPAQKVTTDVCNPSQSAAFDVCWSGLPADDECTDTGGKATDECPGGGYERDTCVIRGVNPTVIGGAIVNNVDSEGDECSVEGGFFAFFDSCAPRGLDGVAWPEDQCGLGWAADVCYEGTNSVMLQGPFNGGEDICMGDRVDAAVRGRGSDTCLDGSDAQDDCGGFNTDYNNPRVEDDVCLPSAAGEKDDHCMSLTDKEYGEVGSPDYCYNGLPSSDECKPMPSDEDECPGGVPEADECVPGTEDQDECPGGDSSVDECPTGLPYEDECPDVGHSDDVCLPDMPGSDECESLYGKDDCSPIEGDLPKPSDYAE